MKKVLIMAFAVLVMLNACKKDEGSNAQNCQLGSYTYSEGTFTSNPYILTFDSQGRITLEKDQTFTTSYTYQTSKIIEQTTGEPTITYVLDAQGKITSGGGKTFKYNTDGYLSEINEGSTKTTLTYTDGELIKIIEGNSSSEKTINLVYKADISSNSFVNSEVLGLVMNDDIRMIYKYLGKESKRIIDYTNTVQNGVTTKETFIYSKDPKGNTSSVKSSKGVGLGFNYNCN